VQFICKILKLLNVRLALFSRPANLSHQLSNKPQLTLAKFAQPSSRHHCKYERTPGSTC